MIEKFVSNLTKRQAAAGRISSEDISVYQYGYTLMVETAINMFIGIAIGVVSGHLSTVLLFSAFFIPLRSYCGGWHAAKSWICIFVSNLTIVFVIWVTGLTWIQELQNMILPADLLCIAAILFICPVDSAAKPMSQAEKKRCRNIAGRILTVHIVFLIMGVILQYWDIVKIVWLVHILQIFVLLTGKIKIQKGTEANEKGTEAN